MNGDSKARAIAFQNASECISLVMVRVVFCLGGCEYEVLPH